MSYLSLDLFIYLFCCSMWTFPMQISLFSLFPGFIVIPKPSQLSQWNSSIATIFLLLKNPATQSLMLLFTLQALQVFFCLFSFFFSFIPPSFLLSPYLFCFCLFVAHSDLEEWSKRRWCVCGLFCTIVLWSFNTFLILSLFLNSFMSNLIRLLSNLELRLGFVRCKPENCGLRLKG